jgi:hypothetical protein
MHTVQGAILALLFCSVIFFSLGFLGLAFYMNREATKDERASADHPAKPPSH